MKGEAPFPSLRHRATFFVREHWPFICNRDISFSNPQVAFVYGVLVGARGAAGAFAHMNAIEALLRLASNEHRAWKLVEDYLVAQGFYPAPPDRSVQKRTSTLREAGWVLRRPTTVQAGKDVPIPHYGARWFPPGVKRGVGFHLDAAWDHFELTEETDR